MSAADPALAVGALVNGRYRVLRSLNETAELAIVEVEHVRLATAAGKTRVLITVPASASVEVRRRFYDASIRAVGLLQQTKPALPVDEVDAFSSDMRPGHVRNFVISSLAPDELADLVAGRRAIGQS